MVGGYGYAGEWTDASGLQYLRARYYSPAQGRFLTKDPFPGFLSQPTTLNPYAYVANNPVLMSDPSGMIMPIVVVAGAGFAVGAIFNAYQQTNGFTNFCHYNIIETLAWGIGGAAAATSAAIMLVSGVGMVGMGLQGFALGLSGLGVSTSLTTSLFIAGSTTAAWSTTAMAWLFTANSPQVTVSSGKVPNPHGKLGGNSFKEVNPNKLNHIFNNPQHHLDDLVDTFNGNQQSAYNAVSSEFSKVAANYTADELAKGVQITVNGFNLMVRGSCIDGIAKIGTFFIP